MTQSPDTATARDVPQDTVQDTAQGAAPHDADGQAAGHPVGRMHEQLRGAIGAVGGAAVGGAGTDATGGAGRDALMNVPVTLRAVLGEAHMPVSRFLALGANDTVALDRMVGDPIDVTVNDRVVARGEIVMLDEDTGQLGVRVVALGPG